MPAQQSATSPPIPQPTKDLWESYGLIYDYLNKALFDSTLPYCVLNFATHGRSNGFFTPTRWQEQDRGRQAHELSLNPVLLSKPIEYTLSWLVRLMVQLQLFEQGDDYDHPQGYYTKAFSDAMWAIGLPCSSEGTPTRQAHWLHHASLGRPNR